MVIRTGHIIRPLMGFLRRSRRRVTSLRLILYLVVALAAMPAKAQDSSLGKPIDTAVASPAVPAHKDSVRVPVHRKSVLQKKADSLAPALTDSIRTVKPTTGNEDWIPAFRKALAANANFNFTGRPIVPYAEPHQVHSRNILFYVLVGILFIYAMIRRWYGKYLGNLFTLLFRVSMRQHQIREQVMQSPLPSLLLNGLFIISGGMYASFLLRYFGYEQKMDFWLLALNSAFVLAIIYLGKFILLKCCGWVFGIRQAVDTYIFIVFLTNKILGIFLLPFLVMLSFSGKVASDILITLSLAMVIMFYAYRFIVSFGPVRKEIKVNGFYFFLYLCAFEIAPLLLIYKVLLNYLEKAY